MLLLFVEVSIEARWRPRLVFDNTLMLEKGLYCSKRRKKNWILTKRIMLKIKKKTKTKNNVFHALSQYSTSSRLALNIIQRCVGKWLLCLCRVRKSMLLWRTNSAGDKTVQKNRWRFSFSERVQYTFTSCDLTIFWCVRKTAVLFM